MKITEYEQIVELTGTEIFLVETEEGTRVMTYAQLVDLIKEKHEEYMEEDIEDIKNTIIGSASSVSFSDTVDLNASTVQEAIENLTQLVNDGNVSISTESNGFGENTIENYVITVGSEQFRFYAVDNVYTKSESDKRYALKGEAGGDGGSSTPIDAYTREEADTRFASKADVANKVEQTEFDELVKTVNNLPSSGGCMSATARILLISILNECVYGTDQRANIEALNEELKKGGGTITPDEPSEPTEATLVSISVLYGGANVDAGTPLTDLADIIVTAHYSDGTSRVVTDYVLSGEIVAGDNTITVTYEGKTAQFSVVGNVVTFDNFAEDNILYYASTAGQLVTNTFGTRNDFSTSDLSEYDKVYFVVYPNSKYQKQMDLKAFSSQVSYDAVGNIAVTNNMSNYATQSLGIITNAWGSHYDDDNNTGYVVFEIDTKKLFEVAKLKLDDGTFKYLNRFRFDGSQRSGETNKLLKRYVD